MKLSAKDRHFHQGILAALAVVALHDKETLYREIVGTTDEQKLIAAADEEGDAEWSGLVRYGYVETGELLQRDGIIDAAGRALTTPPAPEEG